MRRLLGLALLVPALLGGCTLLRPQTRPEPHYVVGAPYQMGGVWRYPREDFAYADTGLATVYDRAGGLTADGEAFDATALAAAHPTLQLPALARVTNLENGRQILVRINDRGPENPGRMLGLTRRAADLLGAAGGTAIRVRVEVQEAESRRMAGGGQQDAPVLAIHSAPPGMVKAEVLAPPPGAGQSGGVRQAAALPVPAARAAAGPAAVAEVPLRLPERVWLTSPRPGSLVIEAGAFSAPAYANLLRERLTAFGARVATDYNAPRDRAFMVRIGPLPTVQAADATLQRVLALVPDARIMVE